MLKIFLRSMNNFKTNNYLTYDVNKILNFFAIFIRQGDYEICHCRALHTYKHTPKQDINNKYTTHKLRYTSYYTQNPIIAEPLAHHVETTLTQAKGSEKN